MKNMLHRAFMKSLGIIKKPYVLSTIFTLILALMFVAAVPDRVMAIYDSNSYGSGVYGAETETAPDDSTTDTTHYTNTDGTGSTSDNDTSGSTDGTGAGTSTGTDDKTGSTGTNTKTKDKPKTTTSKTSSNMALIIIFGVAAVVLAIGLGVFFLLKRRRDDREKNGSGGTGMYFN